MSSERTQQREDSKQPDVNTPEVVRAQISNLKCNQLPEAQISKKLYAKISLVDQTPFTTSPIKSDSAVSWIDAYTFEAPISSSIVIQVCQYRRGFFKDRILGKFEATVRSLFQETSSGCLDISRELYLTGAGGVREKPPTKITFSLLKLAQDVESNSQKAAGSANDEQWGPGDDHLSNVFSRSTISGRVSRVTGEGGGAGGDMGPGFPLMGDAAGVGAGLSGGPDSTSEGHPQETYLYTAKALYAYTASADDSPHEISFTKGEVLAIADDQGKWWPAKKADGTIGIAPSNYLQII